MFQKVLIVEDHESVSISVQKTLTDLGILFDRRNYVYYCDDALNRIKKALAENSPYELLITDLSFEDEIQQDICGGIELIRAVKQVQPDIKILVFSIENRMSVAKKLVDELGIDAFVPKARHDAKDMKAAIEAVFRNRIHLSLSLKQVSKSEKVFDFNDFDKTIICLLSQGTPQKNIPLYLKKNNIRPSGLSSVEKRLYFIKTELEISNNEQLIAFCKDRKII